MAVVYATGTRTEFGHVAHLTTQVKRDPSTLEIQIARIVRIITFIAVSMGVIVFFLTSLLVGMEVKESFIFAIGIIVALVPEGLLPTVTLALAIGVQRMARRNALVRRLSAVETLSATTVICTDKTGTLTKNEMTLRSLWIPSTEIEVTGVGYDPTGEVLIPERGEKGRQTEGKGITHPHPLRRFKSPLPISPLDVQVKFLLAGAALCSNAKLIHLTGPSRWEEIGDPTEAALIVAAIKAGLNPEELQRQSPRVREIPFDSRRRMMTVVLEWRKVVGAGVANEVADGADVVVNGVANLARDGADDVTDGLSVSPSPAPYLSFTKGAPLEVLQRCRFIQRDGGVKVLTEVERTEVLAANDCFAIEEPRA